MAPDLNTVPSSPRPLTNSPRATTRSRRTSQQMPPPTLPLSAASLNILPSNQNAVNNPPALPSPSLSGITATATAVGDNTGVGVGPGPLRHPRPLTAADLHLQLEKEQEAVVNRLTRELSMLRAAQNASVVSNSSSTSAGLPDSGDHNSNHLLSGPSHPAPSQRRHHRSSSSTSTRSITTTTVGSTGGVAGSMASVFTTQSTASDRTRGQMPRHDSIPQSLSRQNSITSSRRSGASSPAPSLTYQHPDYFLHGYPQRPTMSQHREPSGSQTNLNPGELERQYSGPITVQTTGRYEEVAYHRHELDAVKRENEALKRRIRDLERTLRERRQSDASRTRSESVSTTASVSNRDSMVGIGRGRERDKEEDDAVRVGESAGSRGFR